MRIGQTKNKDMRTFTKILALMLFVQIAGMGFGSCTSEEDYLPAKTTSTIDVTHTYNLSFNAIINGYDVKSTRSASNTEEWEDGATVFVKFQMNENSFIVGAAEYKKKANTWAITFKGDLPETANGKCSVCYFDSITSTSGDSIVNISRHHGSYRTDEASYSFNGVEIAISANLNPINGRIRFLGDSIESVKIVGIKSLSSFNAKTFIFESDTSEVMTTCKYANAVSDLYYTDYIYGVFTDSVKPSLYMESKPGAFKRSCNNIDMSSGKSGYMICPQEDNYYGWTWLTSSDVDVFSDEVDLGLSVLWSKKNLGAEYDYDYGYYTSWGDADGTNTSTQDACSSHLNVGGGYSLFYFNSWCSTQSDFTANEKFDRVTKEKGMPWFVPSEKEWLELINSCSWIYTTRHGISGYIVEGKNGNRIFLPFAGKTMGISESYEGLSEEGCYWSSSYNGHEYYANQGSTYYYDYYGTCIIFSDTNKASLIREKQYMKLSIRPVRRR